MLSKSTSNVNFVGAIKKLVSRSKFYCIFIIVPDVFEQYNYKNSMVINPRAKSYSSEYGRDVSCRVSGTEFVACVSENEHVIDLVQELLRKKDHVYLYMDECMPEMTLDAIEGVTVLGTDSQTARRLTSKIYQYKHLKEIIPVVDCRICSGLEELVLKPQRSSEVNGGRKMDGPRRVPGHLRMRLSGGPTGRRPISRNQCP